jgi:hypothetical protein
VNETTHAFNTVGKLMEKNHQKMTYSENGSILVRAQVSSFINNFMGDLRLSLRFSKFPDNRYMYLVRLLAILSRKYSWNSFMLDVVSTPGS